jgi:hypothetical protein
MYFILFHCVPFLVYYIFYSISLTSFFILFYLFYHVFKCNLLRVLVLFSQFYLFFILLHILFKFTTYLICWHLWVALPELADPGGVVLRGQIGVVNVHEVQQLLLLLLLLLLPGGGLPLRLRRRTPQSQDLCIIRDGYSHLRDGYLHTTHKEFRRLPTGEGGQQVKIPPPLSRPFDPPRGLDPPPKPTRCDLLPLPPPEAISGSLKG